MTAQTHDVNSDAIHGPKLGFPSLVGCMIERGWLVQKDTSWISAVLIYAVYTLERPVQNIFITVYKRTYCHLL